MQRIDIQAAPLDTLASLLSAERSERLRATAAHARTLLEGRVVWNVNATAQGGGVAEMLQGLLAYGRSAGVDTQWLVLDADAEFFAITKRLHNAIHGVPDGGSGFGAVEHEHYERVLQENLSDMAALVSPGDIVLLHDPQTAGLVMGMQQAGAHVIWRSHIGRDDTNAYTDKAWDFLRGYIQSADAFVFSRRRYVPESLISEPERLWVIPPSIDPFSAKNREMDQAAVGAVLRRAGLVAGGDGDGDGEESVEFLRRDGSAGLVQRHTDLLWGSGPPPADAPLVVQVSRWDWLKDMGGVLSAFVDHVGAAVPQAHLMLVGPDVSGVSDDPEGAEVLASCRAAWAQLPEAMRERCHLACIPMDDVDENAVIVNAVQRHASVVVQKSLAEGFGLTVTEAMWKRRPVLASAVGGIQDQIVDGRDGALVPDPLNLAAFGEQLSTLLNDPVLGERLGQGGHERVRHDFLGDRHLAQYVSLFEGLIGH